MTVARPTLLGPSSENDEGSESSRWPCDYSALTKIRRNTWTVENKTVLCVLTRFYDVAWTDITAIFNAIFKEQLPSCKGLSRGALMRMHYQLQKDEYDSSGKWTYLRRAIEEHAHKLSIDLVTSSEVHGLEPDEFDIGKDSEHEEVASTTKRDRQAISGLSSPPSSARKQPAIPKSVPRLAFRAYSSESMGINSEYFRAGLFADCEVIPGQPPLQSSQYRNHAARHIGRVQTGVTPFISVSLNLVRCIHHACKNPTISSIALIDLHQALKSTKASELSRVQWVDELMLDSGHVYQKGSCSFGVKLRRMLSS